MEDELVPRLPVDQETIDFEDWRINYFKSHILKSVCIKGQDNICKVGEDKFCELCTFRHTLDLPHLPDMVFHKNKLTLTHIGGAILEFLPMEALRIIENGKQPIQVACAQEWKGSRPENLVEEKFKPFDWTFTTDYQGTANDKFRIEKSDQQLNKFKLMKREKILFYHDSTLFEDELHDNGISSCSVKIILFIEPCYTTKQNLMTEQRTKVVEFYFSNGHSISLTQRPYKIEPETLRAVMQNACFKSQLCLDENGGL